MTHRAVSGIMLSDQTKQKRRLQNESLKLCHRNKKGKHLTYEERNHGSKTFRETFKTITCDNGSENLDCEGIERSVLVQQKRTEVYYAPYSAWERESNESANKLIRRFIPGGAGIGEFSHGRIEMIEHRINNYPRKFFNGQSSNVLVNQLFVT